MGQIVMRGRVVTDYEVWDDAALLVEDGCVRGVARNGEIPKDAEVHDYGSSFLLPGFVDLQVNGCFGIDVATQPGRLPELSERLLATGTTAYLPTLISSPRNLYERALPEIRAATEGPSSGAEVLGAHLEGPFLSQQKRGAHPPAYIAAPDPVMLAELLDLGPVRMVTLAPELEGAGELASFAAGRGAVVSAGHSDAAFEDAYEAFDRRVAGVTHLFNAMSPMHHRAPGLPGAAFTHPRVVCGLISDGLHVHPEMVNLAFRMLGPDRVYLATDATAATGMGPGEYALATRRIYQDANMARLSSGSLAGSLLSMNEAFQNVLAFTGCTLPEAARMASTTPARLVGEGRRKGRLAPGYDADVTVLAPDLSPEAVWSRGRRVY